MKITPKTRLSLLFLVTFSTVTIIVALVILPLHKEIKTLNQKLYDQRVNFEFISEQRKNIVLLEKEIKAIESNKEKITPALLKKNNTLELITSLENIAQLNNLHDQKINLSNLNPLDSGLTVSTLNIDVISTYNDFINWLLELEKKPFYLTIDSISLTSNSPSVTAINGTVENLIKANISTKVYWQ